MAMRGTGADGRRVRLGFGLALRFARQRTRMTQIHVAKLAGISRTSLVKIEDGTHAPSVDTFIAICAAMNARPDTVLRAALRHIEAIRGG